MLLLQVIHGGMLQSRPPNGHLPDQQPGDLQLARSVFAREAEDGHHLLFGAALANCPKLLRRLLPMRQVPGQLVWRSEVSLTEEEWSYIKAVLSQEEIQPLLQEGRRVLVPLPDDREQPYPDRFRPTDLSGQQLKGPRISGPDAKPWNVGRQYFSSFQKDDERSFVWADGIRPHEPEHIQTVHEFGLMQQNEVIIPHFELGW